MSTTAPPDAYLRAAELLGRRVETKRLALKMTQEELAEKAGISRNQVQNIEKNRNNTKDPKTGRPGPANARLDTVFRLAQAFQIDVVELIDPHDR
jgi:transcriptional regulator with XRE-family HTH domain